MSRPLAIDLYCGLGGWTEGLLAAGFDCIGFDIERHVYGEHRYPALLVLEDVLTLDGKRFAGADLIVASPPCTEYSYMAMPWKRAKQIAAVLIGQSDWVSSPEFPKGYKGSRSQDQLKAHFDACFRIQREACAAAGRHIPMVVENVKGAQPWVGPARARYGSYYLWGDVRSVPATPAKGAQKSTGMNWSDQTKRGQDFTRVAGNQAIKNAGGSWFRVAHNTTSGKGQNPDGRRLHTPHMTNPDEHYRHQQLGDGVKCGGEWFGKNDCSPMRMGHSKGLKRKFASAMIAKVPFELANHIGRTFYPAQSRAA